MSITSIPYLLFCVLVIVLYFTVFKKRQWVLLLIASMVFYFINCNEYFYFMIITVASTYFITKKMDNIYQATESKKIAKQKAKKLLLVQLFFSVGVLVFVKYASTMFLPVFDILPLLGIDSTGFVINIIAPLGISFYTFAIVGYTLDVYWRRSRNENNFFKLLLFCIYFPQVLSGPIPRYKNLMPQFSESHSFDLDNLQEGVFLILFGLVKKLIIANRIFYFVNPYFDNPQDFSGQLFILVMMFYSIGGYADFSGTIDIISGVSKILNIKLDPNFNHPYFSRSMKEFWQRWHISLNTWFRDYVLYPVTLSKLEKKINSFNKKHFTKDKVRSLTNMLPLIVVWALTGMWHGNSWNFLIWGLYHFVLLASSLLMESQLNSLNRIFRINNDSKIISFLQMFRTFMLCTIGRIFFRTNDLFDAGYIFKTIFTKGNITIMDFANKNILIIVIYAILLLNISLVEERDGSMFMWLKDKNTLFKVLFFYLLIFSSIALGFYGPGLGDLGFAYQDF
ncbi:MAG: MBOAT family protein [Peptostreptococcaceae bacterium]|nr:MBOAT family protein [Peptostreptococcaceae bacterium]